MPVIAGPNAPKKTNPNCQSIHSVVVDAWYSGIRTLNVKTVSVYGDGAITVYRKTFPRTRPIKSLRLWEFVTKTKLEDEDGNA